MTNSKERERRQRIDSFAFLLLASISVPACAPTLIDRAIEARGGALHSYQKQSDAEVFEGIPGHWSWELAYRAPDSFRWSLSTWGDEQTMIFDGTIVRRRLGSAELPALPADASTRSQARWLAATALQTLKDPGVSCREIPRRELPGGLPKGAAYALSVNWAEQEATGYTLFLDDRYLLVRARGEVSLAPIGSGLLDVSFSDFRDTGGFHLPFSATYYLDGKLVVRESIRVWLPNSAGPIAPR